MGDTRLQKQGMPKPTPGIYMEFTRSEDIRQEDFAAGVAFLKKQIRAVTTATKE